MYKFKIVVIFCMIFFAIGCIVGVTITYNNDLKETSKPIEQKEVKDVKNVKDVKEAKYVKVPFKIIHDKKGLEIKVTNVTNDKYLKIYVSYENNTGSSYELSESLHKIVADGKQQEHDTLRRLDLDNNEPLYNIEDCVKYDSVLIFDKIESNKFNLIFSVDYKSIRINNIIIP